MVAGKQQDRLTPELCGPDTRFDFAQALSDAFDLDFSVIPFALRSFGLQAG